MFGCTALRALRRNHPAHNSEAGSRLRLAAQVEAQILRVHTQLSSTGAAIDEGPEERIGAPASASACSLARVRATSTTEKSLRNSTRVLRFTVLPCSP